MRKSLVVLLHITLLAALLAWPRGVAAAPGISVQPSTVSNAVSTTIVVTATDGAQFTKDEAVVVVDTIGALATTWVNTTTVTAVVPLGAPAGQFAVRVVDTTGTYTGATLTVTGPTNTPEPTGTPAPTAFIRPLLTVQSYGASSAALVPNTDIDFEMTLVNQGQFRATNVSLTFPSGDLIPRVTGGVRAVGNIDPGGTARIFQPFRVGAISGNSVATLEVNVSYIDPNGTSYSEKFTLTFPVFVAVGGGPTRTPTPTATARAIVRPQLLITAYETDVEKLEPGVRFTLRLDAQNMGSATAKRVTMIAGGGSASGGPGTGGTPDPGAGGVSGSGGDFSNFAPVNASNVQSLGDLAARDSLEATQTFVVNATTKAGAYPMKFSFVYADEAGATYTDDQVITLLVYQSPQVDVSFYRQPDPLLAGQPSLLPIQIVNLGRASSVLGNMRVTGESAEFVNNVILVGALDPGGFFTLDAQMTPFQAGPMELVITVDYTDDFNQQQVITKTLPVEVMEAPIIEPGGEDGGPIEPPPPVVQPETFWQKVLRFVRGLLGLGSEQPSTGPDVLPSDGGPFPDEGGPRPGGDGGGVEVTAVPVPEGPKG
jgi:hypothetical protein